MKNLGLGFRENVNNQFLNYSKKEGDGNFIKEVSF